MDDLISRESALKAVEEHNIVVKGMRYSKPILLEYRDKLREGTIDIIKNVPSVDAKIVKYGWWKTVGKTACGTVIRECSCCGIKRKGQAKTPYCPYCGARLNPVYVSQVPDQMSLLED